MSNALECEDLSQKVQLRYIQGVKVLPYEVQFLILLVSLRNKFFI